MADLKRQLLGWCTLMLIVSVVTGCGGGGDVEEEGVVVRYGALGSKIRGMDPMDIGDVSSSAIASNFYEPLYQYHYLKRPYEIIPLVAAEMPTVSDDGLTVTIPIRQDVFFQDDPCFTETDGIGRQVTAHDFIYSWKRLADVKNISKNWWVLDGKIEGLDDFREYTQTVASKQDVDYARPVSGLTAVDDFTIKIKLTRPWPQMAYYLAHLPTAVVAREAVAHYGDELLNHPVGTGPYKLERWDRGSKLILVRNEKFRDEFYPTEGEAGDEAAGLLVDAGKKMPFVDKQVFTVIEEDQPRWLKFMQSEIDVSGIPKDNFGTAINAQRELSPEFVDRGIQLIKFERPTTFWYGFNMEDPVVGQNLPLRRAMNLALNREEFLELFMNNRGRPARGVVPPMFTEYDENLESPYTVYDPEAAKKLIKEAEAIHGGKIPKITLTMGGTDTTAQQTGQYLKRSFAAIGLEFDVDYMDWPTAQERVKNKQAQMYAMGWEADIPDGENFLQLFYGPNKSPGANNMNYDNSEVNALYDQIAVMPDSPERVALCRQIEQLIVQDLPCVFTVHAVAYRLQHPWNRNYKPHVFGYGLMKYQNIDVDQRRQVKGR